MREVGALFNQITRLGLKNNELLSVIVKKVSKVYGPSIKNFYQSGANLGLKNLVTLGFQGFFERNKQSTMEVRGDLNSWRLNEYKGKKWRAFGVNCGFYDGKKQGRNFFLGDLWTYFGRAQGPQL